VCLHCMLLGFLFLVVRLLYPCVMDLDHVGGFPPTPDANTLAFHVLIVSLGKSMKPQPFRFVKIAS
jgi:hypothetical protein